MNGYDILIEPPALLNVATGKNHDKSAHQKSRSDYYDWLAENITIDGLSGVIRDRAFDDDKYRSGGIRLHYHSASNQADDIKDGILLEVGFDNVAPNKPLTISSWVFDFAADKVDITDNRAKNVLCYHPGYTLIEKLQCISTKYRNQKEQGYFSENFMRHYYDVYSLLKNSDIQSFIGSEEYKQHKAIRFRNADNPDITTNEAFLLNDADILRLYTDQYNKSQSLYFQEKPTFEEIIALIKLCAHRI